MGSVPMPMPVHGCGLRAGARASQIDKMTPEAVLNELKDKRLPTYGTVQEKKDRLKKQYGIVPKSKS